MKPPVCEVCGADLLMKPSDPGTLVEFLDYKPLREGVGGHPLGAAWVCSEHLGAALLRTHLPAEEAMTEIRRELGLESPQRDYVPGAYRPALWILEVGPHRARVTPIVAAAMSLGRSEVALKLDELPLLVQSGWPAQLEETRQSLVDAGAIVELRPR